MKVNNIHYKTIWLEGTVVCMIDQNRLPFAFEIKKLHTYMETCAAIKDMTVRGAGAIGAAAAFAMAQAVNAGEDHDKARELIKSTRPTARDLFYAVDKVYNAFIAFAEAKRPGVHEPHPAKTAQSFAFETAKAVALENENAGRLIGMHGNSLIPDKAGILTHCNAGWLAFVDYGSALSPVYAAFHEGKQVHVYADETRPRGQGARLTAWELYNEGVPHTIIADNAAAFMMQKGLVDLIITGADRIAANGDAANKIGTLEKAILAKHFGIPFYIAAPYSTIDMHTPSGSDIVIEERSQDELLWQTGIDARGSMQTVRVASPGSQALNPAFDVTPASLITAFITEKGIFKPCEI